MSNQKLLVRVRDLKNVFPTTVNIQGVTQVQLELFINLMLAQAKGKGWTIEADGRGVILIADNVLIESVISGGVPTTCTVSIDGTLTPRDTSDYKHLVTSSYRKMIYTS